MPDPVLILPGPQATSLRDQRGGIVYTATSVGIPLLPKNLEGRPRGEWEPLMSMAHRPGQLSPEKTSLAPDTALLPAQVAQSPYHLFPKYYEEWPYDWRADLRWNARRLLLDLRVRIRGGEARASLIGHSVGGVLSVLASKMAEPGEFARLVSRVILVGVPLAGTLRAVEALVFGNTGLGRREQPLARAIARTWPAVYQMLPAWPCVTDEQGYPLPREEQLLEVGGWPEGWNEGVSEDMLGRAREVQQMLVNPFENFGPGITVTTILGTNQETGVALTRTDDSFTRIVARKKAGDNLVPHQQTIEWGGNPVRYTVVPFAGQTLPHAELCSDAAVAAFVVGRINAPAPLPPT